MAALLAKTAPGDTIRFPGGTYFFTGDIRLDGTGLTLDGSGTILFEHKDDDPAWNDNRKINITGKKIAVRNLKVTSTAKTRSAVYGAGQLASTRMTSASKTLKSTIHLRRRSIRSTPRGSGF